MATINLSVQLYTLRDLTKVDFAGTVKKVAQIGYPAVELAGFGNLGSAADVKKALDDAGLKVSGAHVGIEQLEADINKVFDTHAQLGNKNIICPYLADTRRKTADDWRKVAGQFDQFGKACREKGFVFSYHNHAFEFEKFGNESGMDILWGQTDPKLVRSELDVYWVAKGGEDPAKYIDALGNRVQLVHLKDMATGPDQKFAPVGTGVLDFKSIIAAGQKAGVEWYAVEQDNCYDTPPLEAITTSYQNLKKLGVI